ncbi:DUF3251 domain-containing protein [Candidatus Symbiopectobacterium sp. NZEC151]|uniref:DUF3251 domain-containing protein n=1 Tax=Candidatus Symbiopectobacterium sp. NZEC151 TaxID=2820470 RepID=UPI002227117F|nr:DUF3251 domain-containing protein [Candidatus Symbiopectobacterium sp. NZEC151]MCW2474783.1 DUF3251 domain-containing protein [Candidatus Symbiopectobacterium sp. NZEC151]
MNNCYRASGLLILVLAGCSAPPQTPTLQREVGQLNRQLQTLTAQAIALEQQNSLNSHSTHGVYLLPSAKSSAILQSNIGKLSVSLSNIESEANGTQALLHIRLLEGAALPAFHAQLDWGQLDPVSNKPLPSETQTQALALDAPLLPKAEAVFGVRLSGVTPEQLGFIRLHQVETNRP